MTFETLVNAIAERDMIQLGSMMEPGLKDSFSDFFETLDEENCEIQVRNQDNFTPPRIRIVDFC